MTDRPARPVIVVGVDGSELSAQALRWAAEQARLTGAEILAVTGYEIHWTIYIAPTYTEADYARDARQVLDQTVAGPWDPSSTCTWRSGWWRSDPPTP